MGSVKDVVRKAQEEWQRMIDQLGELLQPEPKLVPRRVRPEDGRRNRGAR
ncbi:MAG: hypothetical protein ACLFWD_10025 [Anaerolineales bacterium]